MEYLIGFASKFYTLWNHEEEKQYISDSYGKIHCVGIIDKYFYIKNISTSFDKVKELFPNVPIDNNLRGKEIIVEVDDCKFVQGRYPYLMPVINGKAQKTKGKKILVTIIEVKDLLITEEYIQQTIKVS